MPELETFHDELIADLRDLEPRRAGAGQRPGAPRRRLPAWVPRATVPAAAVAACALALALVLTRGGDGSPVAPPAPASAATVLRWTADAAAAQPATLPAGRVAYARWSFRTTLNLRPGPRHGTQERWVGRDGAGLVVVRGDDGATTRERLDATAFPFRIGAADLSYDDLARLGSDPVALDDVLARTRDEEVRLLSTSLVTSEELDAAAAYDVLRDVLLAPAPTAARVAALRRLAAAPGLQRDGDRIALRVGDVRLELRVDPAEGRVTSVSRRLLRRSDQLPGPPRVVDLWELDGEGVATTAGAEPATLRDAGGRAQPASSS